MKCKFEFEINLTGPQGNAFAVMGLWQLEAKENGWTQKEIEEELKEAMRGNYTHLIQTLGKWTEPQLEIPYPHEPARKQ